MKNAFERFVVWKVWLYILCMLPYFLSAQELMVKGKVLDETGEALIGATVQVKGFTTGVITDMDGNFAISVEKGKILVISYLGYLPHEEVVKSGAALNVMLKSDNIELQEVVAIAYGVQKKVSVTGAISSVGSDDLKKTSAPSLGNALAGRLPGLSTVQYSGVPGADDPNIFIRGVGSLNSSNPLVLVDGVERSFTQIDPNEVENISILKDASATAVFGVRGANGVILITTKRGEVGKTKISASTSFGLQSPTRFIDYMGSYEYATFYNRVQELDGLAKDQWKYSDEAILHFKDGDMPLLYPSTNWAKYIMRESAPQSQHNVNLSGGNDRARFFTSVGFLTQEGLFNTFSADENSNFSYNRLNYRANLDLTLNKISSLALNIGGRLQTRTTIGGDEGSIFRYLNEANPMSSPGIVDGKYIKGNEIYVGLYDRDGMETYYGQGYTQQTTNVLNLDLVYKLNLDQITKGLSFSVKGSYNSSYTKQKQRTTGGVVTYLPRLDANGEVVLEKKGEYSPFGYAESSWFSRDWYAEASFNYSRKFGLHDVTGLLLYNQSKTYYPSAYNEIPSGYVGLVGRATYNYASRYLLDVNIGYNGSENFAPGQRYGLFPSASVGWIASEEAFMKKQKVVDYLKIRYSYGMVGNDRMGSSRFLYIPGAWQIVNGYHDIWNYGVIDGYNFGVNSQLFYNKAMEVSSGNPNVSWETATKQNIGIDLRTLNNRLGVNVDVFFEDRKDILINNASILPEYTSMKATSVNLGRVKNKGYEIVLSWTDKIKDFEYTISPSVTFSRNKIIEMAEVKKNHEWLYSTGHPVGQPFGKVFYAFYEGKETEERYMKEFGVDKFPTQIAAGELKPGDCVYVDLDQDGMIGPDDNMAIGYSDNPEFLYSLNANFRYKGFDLTMLWTGADHVSRILGNPFRNQFGIKNNSALSRWVYENSWWPETAETATLPRVTFVNLSHNTQDSEIWIVDASYIRLRNIELGYTFKIPKFTALENARVYLSGMNVLTFSGFQGNDPENKGGTYNNDIRYPLTKVFNIGLQLNF